MRLAAAALLALLLWPVTSFGLPPPERIEVLSRGINITGWFRYPASRDPEALRTWLSDTATRDLRRAGFTFVRLAAEPAVLEDAAIRRVFLDQVRRLERQGLGVIVSAHPVDWNLDTNAADRARLTAFWRNLAPALREFPPALTFAEVLNEPVFRADPGAWWRLQDSLVGIIRAALPDHTIVLTGHDWGSIAGLLALTPVADGNVVYSFHYYDPVELTSLAAWRQGLDRAALARLPFPETDPAQCDPAADAAKDQTTSDMIRFYCATGWDEAHVRSRLVDAAGWGREHGVALLAGEFGVSARVNPAARLAWLALVRATCSANGIGWALWGYDDVMGFDLPRPPGNKPVLDRSVIKALGLSVL
jgi:endoglucanase